MAVRRLIQLLDRPVAVQPPGITKEISMFHDPTYIDRAREELESRIGGQDEQLLDLYLLLVLTQGDDVTLEHVHDAWAIWRSWTRADHPSIVPFGQLKPEVQALDQPYADAIAAAARVLNAEQGDAA